MNPADQYAKAAVGDPLKITAKAWNAHAQAAKKVLVGEVGDSVPDLQSPIDTHIVSCPFDNVTWGDIVRLDNLVPLGSLGGATAADLVNRPQDFQRNPVLAAGPLVADSFISTPGVPTSAAGLSHEPTYPDGFPRFGALGGGGTLAAMIEATGLHGIGRAAIAGLVVTDVVINDESHVYCAPKQDGGLRLHTRKTGTIPILFREPGTGVRKAAVMLGYNHPPPVVSKRQTAAYTVPENFTTAQADLTIELEPGDWHLTFTATALLLLGAAPAFVNLFGGLARVSSTTGTALSLLDGESEIANRSSSGTPDFELFGIRSSRIAFHHVLRVRRTPARFAPYLSIDRTAGSGASISGAVITAIRVRMPNLGDVYWQFIGDSPPTPPNPNPLPPLLTAWHEDEQQSEREDQTYAARLASGAVPGSGRRFLPPIDPP